jgi:hypothetical protein
MNFNLNWFRLNKDSINKKLNFWSEVFWLMQSSNCRLKIYKGKGYSIAKFWLVSEDKKSFVLVKTIKVYENGEIDIEQSLALSDPYVWVLAHRLKYLQFPKVWIRISKWFKHKYGDFCLKIKNNEMAFYFRDSFGNHVLVPLKTFQNKDILAYVREIARKHGEDFL